MLLRREEIKSKVKYFPNSTLYSIGKKIRYVETLYTNAQRKYQIIEVQQTSYLNSIIKKAKKGIHIQDIAESLVNDYITIEDATNYIQELIDAQILVGELSNSVTGEDFLFRIIEILTKIGYSGNELPLLIEVNRQLKNLDNHSPKENITIYQEIIELIRQIGIPFEEKYLFQVDMIRKTPHAELGQPIIDELKKTMKFLNKIIPVANNKTLKKFQEDFYNRYEDREIPLMEALDPELGIGYPSQGNNGDISPLVDDFELPSLYKQASSTTTDFTSLLMQKTIDCLSEKRKEVVFCNDDVKEYSENWGDLPSTMYTMCEILNANPNEILIKNSSFGGSCGANLLGRFSHTDIDIDTFVRDITRNEQELMSGTILAEIVHLPESRIGNILSRPHIRDYELLYLSDSDLPEEQLIHVSDLILSVKQGKLLIRSKKLNKEIVPRLTTAHNFRNNTMPVYRFLCDMQHANGRIGLYFNWGYLENEFNYRPRVRYNNTILSPASWTISINGIKHLFEMTDNDELIHKITEWRDSISLPRKVLMPDGDNELYVDWESPVSIRSLFSIIKNRQKIKFDEFLFDAGNAPVLGVDGKYLNECIVAFYKNE